MPQSTKISFEVLVNEGNSFNETSARRFVTEKPPFIFTNPDGGDRFTFAVRTLTERGLKSGASEQLSLIFSNGDDSTESDSSVNSLAIFGGSVLILIMAGVIIALVIRNRRLHNNFTRFTNSHYNTRSEAATIDDNGLEEDDSPQIRGFSDDEPLVIA